jgi:dipeptidyl-peptidase-4
MWLAWTLAGVCALAQTRQLAVEDVFGAGASRLRGASVASLGWVPDGGPWLDDTNYMWPAPDASGNLWLRVDAHTGGSRPMLTINQLESALIKAGVQADEARRAAQRRPTNFHRRLNGFLLTIGDDLYAYALHEQSACRVTHSPGQKTEATFSPDGRSVAFIKDNNLYVAAVCSREELALTEDGSETLLNGVLDWVYSEELYGRGNYRAYWWSPDSSHIAFLQLNDQPVPQYTLVDDIPYHPIVRRWHYPKAGDPNPIARLGIVRSSSGPITWADTSAYRDFLIVNAGWTPDSRSVIYQVQNRQQSWLDLNVADRATGSPRTLFKESSKTWVERWDDESADPLWLKDGSFVWLSERSGWRHAYHYTAEGKLIRQLTRGDWEVRALHGTDSADQWLYFSGTERSPIGVDVYRIRLRGGEPQRLSSADGRHVPHFNAARSSYLDFWSDITTPPQVRLQSGTAADVVRVVESNPVPALREYALTTPEFLQVKTRDGFVMEAMMIKPPNFDPSRRYPVYQFTYAGPHRQQVVNRWMSSDYLYYQVLAQRGIIVWVCDNRTSSAKGAQSAWPLHKKFGALELRDIEDGLAWLKQQPYVDGSRVGIAGVSYGAYMTLYALTHSKTFAMGIAEGAVTDWRDYDTIYTERYMGTPQENPEGYRDSSPRFAAANLSGQLLLIHSALDDNVHPQNAMQFAYELQKAGKPFQMMIYPKSSHGVSDPPLALHMHRMMLEFTLRHLRP